jgi:hypothetical protein
MKQRDSGGLEGLLSQTRKALLAGDILELASLADGLEATLAQGTPKSLAEAQVIKRMAQENDQLLIAALKGVRSARQRLRDLSEQGRFSTYESNGKRHQPGLGNMLPARRL